METPDASRSQGGASTAEKPAGEVKAAPKALPPVPKKTPWGWIVGGVVLVLALVAGIPWVIRAFTTESTDDAYVNGHVTLVAPRVSGQVSRVLVDDNNRVRKGDLLVQLDKAPYQARVDIAAAAVAAAKTEVAVAEAQARSQVGQSRAARFNLQHAIEDVDNQIALLHARIATLNSQRATLAKDQADYDRAVPLLKTGALTEEELGHRREALLVSQAKVEDALQGVYQVRASLGLSPKPAQGEDLASVPADLDQNFSAVRQAQGALLQAASQLGVTTSSFSQSPKEMIAEFYRRDPQGNIDRIYEQVLKSAPQIIQARAQLMQAEKNLALAQLNLSYTDVVAEIDGVVTRRNVNPGNNVTAGQSLMAVRSLTEVWVDANFKETQLRDLRIGQRVEIEADMYGRHEKFAGRISGFTFGTGSTLALLPAENATGNFVKVVQRLPVRIDLTDYDPDKAPLFAGLSVTPRVYVREEATGPDAGRFLQPYLTTTTAPASAPAPNTEPGLAPGTSP